MTDLNKLYPSMQKPLPPEDRTLLRPAPAPAAEDDEDVFDDDEDGGFDDEEEPGEVGQRYTGNDPVQRTLAAAGLETPPELLEERAARPGAKLYGNTPPLPADVIEDIGKTVDALTPGTDGTLRDAVALEYAYTAKSLGLNVLEAKELVTAARTEAMPDARTARRWREQSAKWIKDTYGHDAAQVLADARALVARDHRLAHMLRETGLSEHPAYVKQLCQAGRRARGAGRFG